jgi:transaldolase
LKDGGAPERIMKTNTYLDWIANSTKTTWWHDSADPAELQLGHERGAVGATTNPYLTNLAVARNRKLWAAEIDPALASILSQEEKAEALTKIAVQQAASLFQPIFEKSAGKEGYVCAQLNPCRAGERRAMLEMARRFHSWAPNISVKLPAVSAGLDVLEDCIAEGISATATISFTVPQVLAVAEKCRAGIRRAAKNGIKPGKCFSVIMIGRLDDYLREVSLDNQVGVHEQDIHQAGLAVVKRAYKIYRERHYESTLMIAAFRGSYHLTEIAGAELVATMSPAAQEWFVAEDFPREEKIHREIGADVIERLSKIPEFKRAYEPNGMTPEEFIWYGATQRTLGQYVDAGWKLLEGIR